MFALPLWYNELCSSFVQTHACKNMYDGIIVIIRNYTLVYKLMFNSVHTSQETSVVAGLLSIEMCHCCAM